jgi:hypothetical protein
MRKLLNNIAGHSGSQTVAKLAAKLNRIDTKWEYINSDPKTSSTYKTERYAYL